MRLSIVTVLLTYVFVVSCSKPSKKLEIEVDFPIEGKKGVELFNITLGDVVYQDTLTGNKVVFDSLRYGIYLFTLKWERDLISVDEFKRLRPTSVNNDNFHSIQKLVFFDPNESTSLKIYDKDKLNKEDFERLMLSKTKHFSPGIKIEGSSNSKLFNAYDLLLEEATKEYYHKTDSLKQLLYTYNDASDAHAAKEVNAELKTVWDSVILPKYKAKEMQFLTANKEQEFVPFVLMYHVHNKDYYAEYKPIIDVLPPKTKELSWIKSLKKYEEM